MLTNKQIKALNDLIDSIREGYGWVAESMMSIYADDADINDWEEVETYMDTFFETYQVCGEKVWDVANLGQEAIKRSYEEDL